ncbi:MAG: hypothetical protein HKN33_07420 [Pyrinomonadaceae bacterium]|nr:hypothetical protein [Pyrinomonadaceae bacterium]
MKKLCNLLVLFTLVFVLSVTTGLATAILKIEKAEVSPRFPKPNQLVKITFTLKNIGDLPMPGVLSLGVDVYSSNVQGNQVPGDYIKAIQWYENNIRALRPNETQKITAEAYLRKEGMHTAYAVIINETIAQEKIQIINGNYKHKFMVTNPADLVLDSIAVNYRGRLILRMHNAGAKIPGQHYNSSEIRVNTTGVMRRIPLHKAAPSMIKLAGNSMPGVTPRYTFVWPATGPYGLRLDPKKVNKVQVTLDYNQKIHDGNRTNNGRKEQLGGKADLVVCFKKYIHSKPHKYSTYRPHVVNIGHATAPASKIRFWIEGRGASMYGVPELPAGARYTGAYRKLWWAAPVGSRKFRLTVDYQKKVDELMENNNRIDGTVIVGEYGVQADWKCSNQPGMTGYSN